MDLSAIIPWIPKLAATLLVMLGVLIVLEIRAMLRKKNVQALSNAPEAPIQVTKVRFPDTGIHTETVQQTKVPTGYKKFLFVIPFVVIALFIFVNFLSGRINTDPTVSPTPIPHQVEAQVYVYKLGQAGDLELLNYDELKALEPNTEIIVAVTADESLQQVTFNINGEEIVANPNERTPNGEVFINYILKPGVVDYYISVTLQ